MKKLWIITLLLFVFTLTGCSSKSKNEFYLNETYSVYVDEYQTLKFTNTTDYKDIVWSSNNQNIATVKNGVLFGMNPGVTTITARAGNFIATATVEVKSDFYISTTKKEIELGNITTLTVRTTLSGTVDWECSNNDVATITKDGLSVIITPNSVGEVLITASLNGKTASCVITVVEAKGE